MLSLNSCSARTAWPCSSRKAPRRPSSRATWLALWAAAPADSPFICSLARCCETSSSCSSSSLSSSSPSFSMTLLGLSACPWLASSKSWWPTSSCGSAVLELLSDLESPLLGSSLMLASWVPQPWMPRLLPCSKVGSSMGGVRTRSLGGMLFGDSAAASAKAASLAAMATNLATALHTRPCQPSSCRSASSSCSVMCLDGTGQQVDAEPASARTDVVISRRPWRDFSCARWSFRTASCRAVLAAACSLDIVNNASRCPSSIERTRWLCLAIIPAFWSNTSSDAF
mmetsp:Transcript_11460/g.32263  ORF Transcript_11460/g.32263 Transcript_11460/m.32263 type:complete len:284 (+) Transcript_11460:449-1300(+)